MVPKGLFLTSFLKLKISGFGTAKLGLIYSIDEQSSADLSHVVDPAVIETAF